MQFRAVCRPQKSRITRSTTKFKCGFKTSLSPVGFKQMPKHTTRRGIRYQHLQPDVNGVIQVPDMYVQMLSLFQMKDLSCKSKLTHVLGPNTCYLQTCKIKTASSTWVLCDSPVNPLQMLHCSLVTPSTGVPSTA